MSQNPTVVKAKSSGEDPRPTRGLVSHLPHPRVNKTKQHSKCVEEPQPQGTMPTNTSELRAAGFTLRDVIPPALRLRQ